MTLSEAINIRDDALTAYREALKSESYGINTGGTSRNIKKQQIDKLRSEYQFWQAEVDRLQGSRRRVYVGVPRC